MLRGGIEHPKRGSFDKIACVFFSAITKESFEYDNKVFNPLPLQISPLLYRGYTCPIGCGACCEKKSLDWLPEEDKPDIAKPRLVEFNNKQYTLYSDLQEDNPSNRCQHLDLSNGRCKIYPQRPYHCDNEMIKFIHYMDKSVLTQKLYGRGWAYTRIDGKKGCMSEILPTDDYSISEVIRKLNRLKQWIDYFELNTWIVEVLDWVQSPNRHLALTLNINNTHGFFTQA